MSLVNRSVVIVYAREPFLEWVNGHVPEKLSLGELNQGCPAFLIKDFEYEEDAWDAVNDEWPVYFETWLESWVQDESKWPSDRTAEQFHAWFDVSLHPMVFDRLDEPVVHEDDADEVGPTAPHRALH